MDAAEDRAATEKHPAQFPATSQNVRLLNENIKNWLNSSSTVNGQVIPTNVVQKYKDCQQAPNYTVFSNTTSAQEWNENLDQGEKPMVALESPHHSIHRTVGGCDIPSYNRSPIPGAIGDMGENDTAGLHPT
ncbi:tyrosinase family protein [Cyclobacterium xiamenense]|uniref:tyrosinase family protein n=1 Tax=Cyclobacterium xiamenense TaxID=1297121 RepID=UPI0019D5C8B5|nr:tyrosinase family protein [Cyclobacterium xiamenense]